MSVILNYYDTDTLDIILDIIKYTVKMIQISNYIFVENNIFFKKYQKSSKYVLLFQKKTTIYMMDKYAYAILIMS